MVNNESCCFAKILKVIEILQNKNDDSICCEGGCDRPFLGPSAELLCYNTRPVQFYIRNGNLFTANYNNGEADVTSNIFRVEKVNNCCCKCRILALSNPDDINNIVSTDNFITINLKCICAIKCLNDIVLEDI